MTHPLDREFGMIDDPMNNDDYSAVSLPESQEDRNLDLITNLALAAYKDQMEDLVHIEPKNRGKYLDIAERFLNQAKDAIYKKDYLKMQREKKGAKVAPPQAQAPEQESPAETIGRKELMERMRLVKQ